ncbi:MAG TPA: DUF2141 domain-containing protein [Polyangiales bacterium]
MRRWLLALTALVLSFGGHVADAQQPLTTVTVKITGFRGVEGLALITLYDSEQSWLKMPKAIQVVRAQLAGPELSVDFKDVKPGTYAVQVIHDENKNNKLDMRWLPWPKPLEGVGVSNDPDNKAGAPKWDDAKFDVGSAPLAIKVTVRYVE